MTFAKLENHLPSVTGDLDGPVYQLMSCRFRKTHNLRLTKDGKVAHVSGCKSGDKAVGLVSCEFQARIMFKIKPVFVFLYDVLCFAAAAVKRNNFLRKHVSVRDVCDKRIVVVAGEVKKRNRWKI